MALGATGPVLRSTGVDWDLRRGMPYLKYPEVEFDVIVGTYGDAFDRYAIRLNEVRESMRIVRQVLDRMPPGDYRIQDKKVTPPPRARIDESMEALIHHFKIFTEGFKVPEGEVYVAVESPRGELGCYIASDGSAKPYRMHMRAPSFVNIQCLPHMMRGGLVADAVADHLLRRPGPRRRRPMNRRSGELRVPAAGCRPGEPVTIPPDRFRPEAGAAPATRPTTTLRAPRATCPATRVTAFFDSFRFTEDG